MPSKNILEEIAKADKVIGIEAWTSLHPLGRLVVAPPAGSDGLPPGRSPCSAGAQPAARPGGRGPGRLGSGQTQKMQSSPSAFEPGLSWSPGADLPTESLHSCGGREKGKVLRDHLSLTLRGEK